MHSGLSTLRISKMSIPVEFSRLIWGMTQICSWITSSSPRLRMYGQRKVFTIPIRRKPGFCNNYNFTTKQTRSPGWVWLTLWVSSTVFWGCFEQNYYDIWSFREFPEVFELSCLILF